MKVQMYKVKSLTVLDRMDIMSKGNGQYYGNGTYVTIVEDKGDNMVEVCACRLKAWPNNPRSSDPLLPPNPIMHRKFLTKLEGRFKTK